MAEESHSFVSQRRRKQTHQKTNKTQVPPQAEWKLTDLIPCFKFPCEGLVCGMVLAAFEMGAPRRLRVHKIADRNKSLRRNTVYPRHRVPHTQTQEREENTKGTKPISAAVRRGRLMLGFPRGQRLIFVGAWAASADSNQIKDGDLLSELRQGCL